MAPPKSITRRPVKAAPPPAPEVDAVDQADVEDVEQLARPPKLGERVLVAVHPDRHGEDGDDVAVADVTRVLVDEDGRYSVNLRVHYDAGISTGYLAGVPWYPDRHAFEQAEETTFLLLPGHEIKRGKVAKPGENHITQSPWRVEDVRHWQTGAWPLDSAEE